MDKRFVQKVKNMVQFVKAEYNKNAVTLHRQNITA